MFGVWYAKEAIIAGGPADRILPLKVRPGPRQFLPISQCSQIAKERP